jgi:hypothetical protein
MDKVEKYHNQLLIK